MTHEMASTVKAWNTRTGREVVSLGRELLGGNGIVSDFLVAKVRVLALHAWCHGALCPRATCHCAMVPCAFVPLSPVISCLVPWCLPMKHYASYHCAKGPFCTVPGMSHWQSATLLCVAQSRQKQACSRCRRHSVIWRRITPMRAPGRSMRWWLGAVPQASQPSRRGQAGNECRQPRALNDPGTCAAALIACHGLVDSHRRRSQEMCRSSTWHEGCVAAIHS